MYVKGKDCLDTNLAAYASCFYNVCTLNTRMCQPTRLDFVLRLAAIVLFAFLSLPCSAASAPCRIEVVEKDTGWPVPLVELTTTHHVRFVTDNAGLIAFDLPELMGRETWFTINGQGYEVPQDDFGNRGVHFVPESGKTNRIEVQRTIIARRLGRLTGGGLFAEGQKLGQFNDWHESGILGSDTVQTAIYHSKLFWLWGDTVIPSYPLGIFDSSSATTPVKPLSKFEPPLQVLFNYFNDDKGRPRGVAPVPGKGPTWITGYLSLPDASGKEHLVGTYLKIRNHLDVYQVGLVAWDDQRETFETFRVLWNQSEANPKPGLFLDGHPAQWTDPAGKKWVLFGNPFPTVRCPATFEAWGNTNTWEPLKHPDKLLAATTGETVKLHSGSIAWNPWRKRWVTVFMQAEGKPSYLGELWYAEADSPMGPWGRAVKILSHNRYTFYNPRLHPEFTSDNSPILIFEGTYTMEFSGNSNPTPRYDYNQILYRLDLDDPRLKPAQEP
ncbi:signal peptide protein [Pedosphaera parvula Ellin514]|uniref:Signal peptide protein n=2 Tax=Pedosphaera TaxID=1032526 RepID=B9XCK9_PEDPL|nr:signal peptide protein [Pedosphaera parvula Ellin514]